MHEMLIFLYNKRMGWHDLALGRKPVAQYLEVTSKAYQDDTRIRECESILKRASIIPSMSL